MVVRKDRMCDKQEKRVCKNLGVRRQVASGSTPFLKGDCVSDDLFIECKTKNNISKSFSIKKEWILKMREEAFSMGKENSILVFSFGDAEDFMCCSLNDFKGYYEAYKEMSDIRGIISNVKSKDGLEGIVEAYKYMCEVVE